jgi:GT2 family glycosyltransferase/ADP-heptose:LPS heptosyltransferase
MKEIIVRRRDALGDVLASTVVADKLAEKGFSVHFQTLPVCQPIARRVASVSKISGPENVEPHVHLDGAYENNPRRSALPFSQMFIHEANRQLDKLGINLGPATNCKPKLRVTMAEMESAAHRLKNHPRPWVFICPRSCAKPRTVPDVIWEQAAKRIRGTSFWIGTHDAPPGIVDLKIRDVDSLIVQMSSADLLVTTDTGPMHFGAALGVPIVALGQASSPDLHLNDQNDFIVIYPEEKKLGCLNCQHQSCPICEDHPPCQDFNPDSIADAVNWKAQQLSSGRISAVIPIYRPTSGMLNRCLDCVLSQVDEVILTMAADGVCPAIKPDPKIKLVVKPLSGIGFGKNVNFGIRHSSGQFILLLNHDVFLRADAVARMKECMAGDVSLVGNLLRYPDGTIQHAGKVRSAGEKLWHHADHRSIHPGIKEPRRMDNTCGACWLARRSDHFLIDGFDEDYFLYCEDDDYCLKLGREGKGIVFTPHSEGVHLESVCTKQLGDKSKMIEESQSILLRKWGHLL